MTASHTAFSGRCVSNRGERAVHTMSLPTGHAPIVRRAAMNASGRPARKNEQPWPQAFYGTRKPRSKTEEQHVTFRASTSDMTQQAEDPLKAVRSAKQGAQEARKTGDVFEGTWTWRGHNIRYQRCGDSGPPLLLIHGFGGNCDHWRKNLPILGKQCRTFAIDLLGYGYSDKPDPRLAAPNAIYNYENWGQQSVEFIAELIGEPCLVVCNSVGGLVGLQAAHQDPSLVKAVQVHNISLRMLHITKQTRLQRLFVTWLQNVLRETNLGIVFFGAIAKPKAVRNVLRQCYGRKEAVDEELVDYILKPGLQPGAAQVFLDFISYSSGPLPEDLIQSAPCPVSVLWDDGESVLQGLRLSAGDKDPWEKVEWGRKFKAYSPVEEFVELPGVGHCPMDEAPELVNPIILAFAARHSRALERRTDL